MRSIMLAVLLSVSFPAIGDKVVKPHIRKDGTFVDGHIRSQPNQYKFDNYSSKGNTNPYTGKRGSAPHEFSPPSRQRR